MIIAAISDIHDMTSNLVLVMEEIRKHGCDRIVCMGDICEPSTLNELIQLRGGVPLDMVFGNNDEQYPLLQVAAKAPGVTFHEEFGTPAPDGFRLALTHYPHIAQKLARTGNYDAVLYGHDHQAASKHEGACILANPGEIAGYRTGRITYGLLDTQGKTFTIHPIIF